MSEKEATRFISDLQTVEGMASEFTKLNSDPQACYDLLKSKGYDATHAEVREAYFEFATTALSEEQISQVAAGLSEGAKAGIGVAAGVGAVGVGVGAALAVVGVAMAASGAAAI